MFEVEMTAAEPFSTIEQKLVFRSPNAVLFVSPEWRIVYANRLAVQIAHVREGQIEGAAFWDALPEFADGEQRESCLRAMREHVQGEFHQRMRSGRWLHVCIDPHETGIALYCRDVTDGKLAELALQQREVELHDFLQNGNVAIHWVSPDGNILWANQAELCMLGYTAEEYIGRSIKDFHVDPLIIEDILCRLTNNETLEHYESRLRCKDGSIRHVAINSSVYRKDGEFVHTRCFTQDMTAEKARAEIQALLSAIVESSDDAIISKDLNGVITSWNKTAERVFGYSVEEAVGQSVAALLIPEDRQGEEPEILSRLRRGERVDHFQTKRRHKDGHLLDISLTISPVKDARGQIAGASKIARDITEMVKNQEALGRSNADLEQFVYSASHDLQEPLRMVSIYAEMLRQKCGANMDANAEEYLGFVIEGGARMERLLQDLRAYTQVSMSAPGPPPVVDARVALNKAIGGLKTAIEENTAHITSSDLPAAAIYEFQLEQLFQNIIGNAIRYRSEAPPRIHVHAERQDSSWRFSIQDNGIGIDQEYKEQIFGLFTRLHTTSEYPGTGMGLAICQRIVERAGGRIGVDSEPGKGSTFYFLLPGPTAH